MSLTLETKENFVIAWTSRMQFERCCMISEAKSTHKMQNTGVHLAFSWVMCSESP